METTTEQYLSNLVDTDRMSCQKCREPYWAPLIKDDDGSSPIIFCESCTYTIMRENDAYNDEDAEKLKKIFHTARMKVN